MLERGALGVWLVGEAGALLVRGRRVHCWCVRATDPSLPSGDRIAHLLLALRADEAGFATVANHAFAGARWRVRRRLPEARRARRCDAADLDSTEWIVAPREDSATGTCRRGCSHRTMVGMPSATALTSAGLPVRRLALVSTNGRSDAAVRRYRLARLRLEDREVTRAERFAHLKRSHD